MDEKETTKLTYDDRRKILIQEKSMTDENKTPPVEVDGKVTEESKLLSKVNQNMRVEYTEAGIKLAYKNLSNQRTAMEKRIADLKEKVENDELSQELQKLKENMTKIANHVQAEKLKFEYENLQEELKKVKKEIDEIKGTIGNRLKL